MSSFIPVDDSNILQIIEPHENKQQAKPLLYLAKKVLGEASNLSSEALRRIPGGLSAVSEQ